jgi:hypothetical protein
MIREITLLREDILPERKQIFAEAREDTLGKFFYLKGLFIEGDVKNHNGRIYPREEIARAVADLNERIKTRGPVAGELDHPEGININFDRVAVAITEMYLEGSNGFGTMRVVPAGLGLIIEGCIKAGINVGVSSRGSGRVETSGKVSDFEIITIDAVINPSAPNAYPKMSLGESIYGSQYGKEIMEMSKYIHDSSAAQKHVINEFKKLFSIIETDVTRR